MIDDPRRKALVLEFAAWLQRERINDEPLTRTAERMLAIEAAKEGSIREASRVLGISVKKLYELLRESGLKPEPVKKSRVLVPRALVGFDGGQRRKGYGTV